jgi:hypothetical protein
MNIYNIFKITVPFAFIFLFSGSTIKEAQLNSEPLKINEINNLHLTQFFKDLELKSNQINIQKKYIITGKVKLPSGILATHNMEFFLDAYDTFHGSPHFSAFPVILQGANSAEFKIEFPQSTFKKFKLTCINWSGGYFRESIYTKKGVIPYYEMNDDSYYDPLKDNLKNISFEMVPDLSVLSETDMKKKGEEKGTQIAQTILKPEYTEFEKIIVVNDYLMENYEYFNEQLAVKYKLLSSVDTYHQMIPFLNKIAICSGYSDMAIFLLNQSGMKAEIIPSHPIHDHGWVSSSIGNRNFLFDTTANDSWSNYSRFLLSEKQFVKIVFPNDNYEPDYLWNSKKFSRSENIFVFKESHYPHKELLSDSKMRRIFGNIKLPNNEKAGKNGVKIFVNDLLFYIPPGENSCFLSLRVPVEKFKDGYALNLKVGDGFESGYYNKAGMFHSLEKAELLNLTGLDITNIDIVLIKKIPFIETVSEDNWKGEYFDNINLQGNPWVVRNDGNGQILFDWGIESPHANIPQDNFSIRLTRNFLLDEGDYVFTIGSDDGVKVFIDNKVIVDEWRNQAFTLFSKNIRLTKGSHKITIEYYDQSGSARLTFKWEKKPTIIHAGKTVTLKNKSTNKFLKENNGNLMTDLQRETNSQWLIERIDEESQFIRIKNKISGNYLHIQNQNGSIELSVAPSGWWSSHWLIYGLQGSNFLIGNRWQQIHIAEDNSGKIVYIQDSMKSSLDSQWVIEEVR